MLILALENAPRWLYVLNSTVDAVNECSFFLSFFFSFLVSSLDFEPFSLFFLFLVAFELCLIMLISSGWGVIFTHVRPAHKVILTGEDFLQFLLSLASATPEPSPSSIYFTAVVCSRNDIFVDQSLPDELHLTQLFALYLLGELLLWCFLLSLSTFPHSPLFLPFCPRLSCGFSCRLRFGSTCSR